MTAHGHETVAVGPSGEQLRSASAERRKRFGLLLLAIVAVFVLEGVSTPGPGSRRWPPRCWLPRSYWRCGWPM